MTNRNRYRERRWDTWVGGIGLAIPKVRDGSYVPSPVQDAGDRLGARHEAALGARRVGGQGEPDGGDARRRS
jgi:transposase-like protein